MAKLAINGGKAVRTKSFTSWPIFNLNEEEAVLNVLRSGNWFYGERVKEFEKNFSKFQDAKYGITVTNGTSGLEIALKCLGIGAGDEVIVTPYSFISSATSALLANAVPVFADIEEDTFNISPKAIEEAITERTRAIIPVHIGGLPCDMDAIMHIARDNNLKVIEDACHSWGSKWSNIGIGSIGDAGIFSFQMYKNITAGEGGIIITNNRKLAETCYSYIRVGRKEEEAWYKHFILGGCFRMTEIQAAILNVQLSRLEEQNEIRRKNALYLDKKLIEIPGTKILKEDSRVTKRAYHKYIFRYIKKDFGNLPRDIFLKALNAEGIPGTFGYPHPLYKNPLFDHYKGLGARNCPVSCSYYNKEIDYSKISLPVVDRICNFEAVWLDHTMLLGDTNDMDDIINAIKKISSNLKELKRYIHIYNDQSLST